MPEILAINGSFNFTIYANFLLYHINALIKNIISIKFCRHPFVKSHNYNEQQ